ncbi:MAG: hypothetical protein ACPKPY_00810 [Nitrososphaeraceae archaeon]
MASNLKHKQDLSYHLLSPNRLEGPPYSIETILNLAWGLTLTIAEDTKQNEKGSYFLDAFKSELGSYETDDIHGLFIRNLLPLLSSYLRKTGIKRDIYIKYVKSLETNRNATYEYAKELEEHGKSVTSKGGVFFKIASFFGGGSLSNIIFSENNMADQSIFLFLAGGLAGLILIPFFVSYLSNFIIQRENRRSFEKENKFYQIHLRREFQDDLRTLREQICLLIMKCYTDNFKHDPFLDNFDDPIYYIRRILNYIEGKNVAEELGQQGKCEDNKMKFIIDLIYTLYKFVEYNKNKEIVILNGNKTTLETGFKTEVSKIKYLYESLTNDEKFKEKYAKMKFSLENEYSREITIDDLRSDYIDVVIDGILPHESLFEGTYISMK